MRKNKNMTYFMFASIIILSLLMAPICYSKGKLSSGEKGMAFLITLQDRGLVNWSINPPFFNVFVEPKLWQSYTHKEKTQFCRHVLNTVKYLLEKGQKVGFYSVFDMTSQEKLARGNINKNNVEIIK